MPEPTRKPIATFTPRDVVFLRNAQIEADSIAQERLEQIERENRRKLYKLGPRAVDRILDDLMALKPGYQNRGVVPGTTTTGLQPGRGALPPRPRRAQVQEVEEVQWDALVATVKNRDAAIAAARQWRHRFLVLIALDCLTLAMIALCLMKGWY